MTYDCVKIQVKQAYDMTLNISFADYLWNLMTRQRISKGRIKEYKEHSDSRNLRPRKGLILGDAVVVHTSINFTSFR